MSDPKAQERPAHEEPTGGAGGRLAPAQARHDGVHSRDPNAGTARPSVTDECRRLAELLKLDAVGVVTNTSGRRRVAWWAAPGSPALPSRLDDITEGRVQGWIVSPLPQGSVFGRITPASSVRSASILGALGPSLAEAAAGGGPIREEPVAQPESPGAGAQEIDRHTRGDLSDQEAELGSIDMLVRIVGATRKALETGGCDFRDLLDAMRVELPADEIIFLTEDEGDFHVLAVPDGDRPRGIPPEVRPEVRGLPPTQPIDHATARRLGIVLGARSSQLSAAFCAETGPTEILIAGRSQSPAIPLAVMRAAASLVGAARAAFDSRQDAVGALMREHRTRLAYEIHDGLTQAVTTAVLELEALGKRVKEDPAEALRDLDLAKAEVRRTLDELRGILFDLSDEPASERATPQPIAKYVDDVVKRWRLPAQVSLEGDLQAAPRPVLEAAYVVIRESLANAAKHSSSQSVAVRVHASGDEVEVEVEDTGRGFTTSGKGRRAKHFGLEMMRRRVEEVDGTLAVESSPGNGTRVVARLPVRQQGEKP